MDYPALENGWQVGGNITTDGTLGVITYANVWGACMEVTGPGGTFYAYDYTPYLEFPANPTDVSSPPEIITSASSTSRRICS